MVQGAVNSLISSWKRRNEMNGRRISSCIDPMPFDFAMQNELKTKPKQISGKEKNASSFKNVQHDRCYSFLFHID